MILIGQIKIRNIYIQEYITFNYWYLNIII